MTGTFNIRLCCAHVICYVGFSFLPISLKQVALVFPFFSQNVFFPWKVSHGLIIITYSQTLGTKKTSPGIPAVGQFLQVMPSAVSRSASLPFPLWVPEEGMSVECLDSLNSGHGSFSRFLLHKAELASPWSWRPWPWYLGVMIKSHGLKIVNNNSG